MYISKITIFGNAVLMVLIGLNFLITEQWLFFASIIFASFGWMAEFMVRRS